MSDLLNKASLVVIPSGYKEDTVYSVVPSDGSGDLSFTRASNGTRVNSAGLVEVCPWNLTEKSNNFANWLGVNNVTITANDTTAPNGTTTASKIVVGSGSPIRIFDFIGNPTQGVYTISVYAKAGTGDEIILYTTNAYVYATYNLSNGTVTQGVGTASIENAGNGWYRCIVTNTIAAGEIGQIIFSGNSTNEYVYLYGYQTNVGSTAKPYFPTTDRLNVPRLTYQNGGGGCPSLLLEKQSTNLALWSEDFTQSVWSLVFLVRNATANTAISPDGTQNADTISDSITTAEFGAGQLITATANTPQTTSIFVKANASNFAMLRFYGNDIQKYYCVVVNLSTGVITKTQAGSSTSSTSSSITNMGNGWYRITATATMNTTDYYLIVNLVPSATPTIGDFGNSSYTGTGSNSIYVWGAQFE
jgi:hypothetical protein